MWSLGLTPSKPNELPTLIRGWSRYHCVWIWSIGEVNADGWWPCAYALGKFPAAILTN